MLEKNHPLNPNRETPSGHQNFQSPTPTPPLSPDSGWRAIVVDRTLQLSDFPLKT